MAKIQHTAGECDDGSTSIVVRIHMRGDDAAVVSCRLFDERELLEQRWRAIGVDGHIVICSIHRVRGPGLQVRIGYSSGEWQRVRHVANLEEGRELAETWRRLVVARGLTQLADPQT